MGIARLSTGGFVTNYPLTIRHRDGRLTHVLYNASVYRDAKQIGLGVFADARDLMAQKRAEAEVTKQRANEMDRLAELERFPRLTSVDPQRYAKAFLDIISDFDEDRLLLRSAQRAALSIREVVAANEKWLHSSHPSDDTTPKARGPKSGSARFAAAKNERSLSAALGQGQ